MILDQYGWFWMLLVALAVALTVLLWLMELKPWRASFDGHLLLLVTPWVGVTLAHEALDVFRYQLWTGMSVFRPPVGGLEDEYGYPLPWRIVFQHELMRRCA